MSAAQNGKVNREFCEGENSFDRSQRLQRNKKVPSHDLCTHILQELQHKYFSVQSLVSVPRKIAFGMEHTWNKLHRFSKHNKDTCIEMYGRWNKTFPYDIQPNIITHFCKYFHATIRAYVTCATKQTHSCIICDPQGEVGFCSVSLTWVPKIYVIYYDIKRMPKRFQLIPHIIRHT